MPSAQPLREQAAPNAYERLRDLIVRGRLAPGARVVEVDIAARLGVSRTPAREAIHQLEHEGLLTSTGNAGRTQLVVPSLTVDDLVDLYSIMASLEGTAAANITRLPAAQRLALGRALRKADDAFKRVARSAQPSSDLLFELHGAFHQQFVDAGATPRLRDLIARIRPQMDRYEYAYAPLVGPSFDVTFREHRAIIRALATGSRAAAENAVRANWLNSADRLATAIHRSGPRGDW